MNTKFNKLVEEFKKVKKEGSKQKTLINKQESIEKQIDALFKMITEIAAVALPAETATVNTEGVVKTTAVTEDKKKPTKKTTTKKKNATKKKTTFAQVKKVLTEEFESWKLKVDWLGYKYLMTLAELASKQDLSQKSYDEICALINPNDVLLVKRSITFIRQRAEFPNAKYFAALRKMPADQITNEIIFKEIIELYK